MVKKLTSYVKFIRLQAGFFPYQYCALVLHAHTFAALQVHTFQSAPAAD